jgi:hypothetical protein
MAPLAVHDLPLEVLTHVCQHLELVDLILVARSCRRFRHGELETVELPTESPVVTVLLERAFPRLELAPRTRPIGCSESWVAYLARCVRQRRCREAPPIAAGLDRSLFVDAAGRLLACGIGAAVGHGDEDDGVHPEPAPVAGMAGLRVRIVAAGSAHSLALGWDGRVYSWGQNDYGQLGLGDKLTKASPALVKGLEGVRGIAASAGYSLAVTQTGGVFHWGESIQPALNESLRPITVEGFGGLHVRRVCASSITAFAIGEAGELFSWGSGAGWALGHGDKQNQPSPKRVEALRGVWMSSVSVGWHHTVALAEDGLVYAWGKNQQRALLGETDVERELLPKPVEALRGVRVGNVAVAQMRTCALADTGEVWAWGCANDINDMINMMTPIGHGERVHRPLPEGIQSLRGAKVDAVTAIDDHMLTLADDG